jgi:TPR repeat
MTKKSIFSRINQSEEPEIDSLTQNRSNNKLIQDIESHLSSLTDSLQKGEFPINIKKITQVFDAVVTIDRLPINVPADKFVDLYNDLPNILTGYAIGATLSDESYREQSVAQITFHRLDRGTYWIFPTDRIGRQGAAWLVPNPLKDIKISKNKSLNFSFSINSPHQNNSDIIILDKPALVQILPNSDRLTWKLTERGEIRTGGSPTASNSSINSADLTKQIEQIIQAQLQKSDQAILERCQELIDRSFASQQHKESNTVSNGQSFDMLDAEIISTENIINGIVKEDLSTNKQINLINAKEYFDRGKQKEKEKDLYRALDNYDKAIEIDPNFAGAYFNRGLLKKNSPSLKDITGAITDLTAAAVLYKQEGKLDIYESLQDILWQLS